MCQRRSSRHHVSGGRLLEHRTHQLQTGPRFLGGADNTLPHRTEPRSDRWAWERSIPLPSCVVFMQTHVASWYTRVFVPGLTQYSGDPRTEWQLNDFTTKDQLLEAVRNFRYKGGNTFTGKHMLMLRELPNHLELPPVAKAPPPCYQIGHI